ncbi:Sodium/hydrogen exchanger 9B2, partial [Xenotaenia resolanae]
MLLAGLLLRNVPYITDAIFIDTHWSAALRSIALSIILTRAGLGLDPSVLRRLKAVCVRVAVGPCMVEACINAVVSHFLLSLPWVWSFILGFVLAAVSPAVVVPSMLLLQKEGYGVEKISSWDIKVLCGKNDPDRLTRCVFMSHDQSGDMKTT